MKKLNESQLRNIIREAVKQLAYDAENDIDLLTGEPLGKEYYDKMNTRAPKELKGRCQKFLQQLSRQIGNINIMQDYCDDEWRNRLNDAESRLNEAYEIVLGIYKQIEGESTINGEPFDVYGN